MKEVPSIPPGLRLQTKVQPGVSPMVMAKPSMELAYQILQMPSPALRIFLQEQMVANPLIDLESSLDGAVDQEQIDPEEGHEESSPEEELTFEEGDYRYWDLVAAYESMHEDREESNHEGCNVENMLSFHKNPLEEIRENIEREFQDDSERKIAHHLFDSLESNGFITMASLKESSEALRIDYETIEKVRTKLMHLEPLGIASFDTREFLLLQLESRKKSLAYEVVMWCFDLLMGRSFKKMSRVLGCSEKVLMDTVEREILPLSFSPLSSTGCDPANPDIVIDGEDGVFQVILHPWNDFDCQMTESYTAFFESGANLKSGAKRGRFLLNCLNNVRWISHILDQRRYLLKKVAESILEYQREFFLNGKVLLPWTQAALAESLGLSPATVSRAIQEKTLLCDQGFFSLQHFFPSHTSTQSGDRKISSTEIKQLIQEMIDREDKIAPLSDQRIAERLQSLQIACSRRTVTKYRSHLKIERQSERKRN